MDRTRRRIASLAAVIAFASIGAAASTARAQGCECSCLAPTGPFLIPPSDRARLATNARIFAWLTDEEAATVRLVQGEREVAVRVEAAADDVAGAFWIVPTEPLARAGGDYVVSAGTPPQSARFVVVDEQADVDAPILRGASAAPIRDDTWCAAIVGAAIEADVEPEQPYVRVHEIELLRGETVIAHRFAPSTIFGTASAPECLGPAHVDGLVEGETLRARIRVWDAAGNASAAVELEVAPASTRAGSDRPCGRTCSVAPPSGASPSTAFAAALLLAAIGWRRSRAARRG